jgi:hypothetical protein
MNKEKFLAEADKVHKDRVKMLREWVADAHKEFGLMSDIVACFPEDLPEPDSIVGGSLNGVTLKYPLDHTLMKQVMTCMSNTVVNGHRAVASETLTDSYSSRRHYTFGELTVTVRFEENTLGSTCKLVKVSEHPVTHMEAVYKVDCTGDVDAELAGSMVDALGDDTFKDRR